MEIITQATPTRPKETLNLKFYLPPRPTPFHVPIPLEIQNCSLLSRGDVLKKLMQINRTFFPSDIPEISRFISRSVRESSTS
jgi:hypothetical protein